MNYTHLSNRARKLLIKYGTHITISHHNPGTFDPIHGHYVGGGTVSCQGNAIVQTPRDNAGDKFIDGTLIQTGDRQLVIATGATLTPALGDHVTLASVLYGIVATVPVKPADTVLVHKVLLRR
jgi:hypothetical protein